MKVTIERNPSPSHRHETAQIVAAIYNKEATTQEVIEYFEKTIGDRWFFYRGGSHIAIHERDDVTGEVVNDRLIIITEIRDKNSS